jgi:hypothetical protein
VLVPPFATGIGIATLDILLAPPVFIPLLVAAALLPFNCQAGIPGVRNPNELARVEVGGVAVDDSVVLRVGEAEEEEEGKAGVEIEVERMGDGIGTEGVKRAGVEGEVDNTGMGAAGAGPVGRAAAGALVRVRRSDLRDFNSVDKSARD